MILQNDTTDTTDIFILYALVTLCCPFCQSICHTAFACRQLHCLWTALLDTGVFRSIEMPLMHCCAAKPIRNQPGTQDVRITLLRLRPTPIAQGDRWLPG